MSRLFLIISIICLLWITHSCHPYPGGFGYLDKTTLTEPLIFQIEFLDEDGNELIDYEIEYAIKEDYNILRANRKLRMENGLLQDTVIVNPKYGAVLLYKITKSGFCTKEGRVPAKGTYKKDKIFLYRAVDKYSKFEISVLGLKSKPIDGVQAEFKFEQKNEQGQSGKNFSDTNGLIKDSVRYYACYEENELGKVSIKLSKENYYDVDTTLRLYTTNKNQLDVVMVSLRDYFDSQFLETGFAVKLVEDISDFIDLIVLNTYLTDNILKYFSIKVILFKNQKYLTFEFQDFNEYNYAQLNKYDIGKRIFDEGVRKILNPLNDYISDSKEFNGYALRFNTSARNFVNENSKSEALVYEYYIPKNIVRAYKNLDITGQKVLDESIILLDGERIDLKLQ